MNAAHTESKEAQEILFKSSAEATAKEIRRVKRGKRSGEGGRVGNADYLVFWPHSRS